MCKNNLQGPRCDQCAPGYYFDRDIVQCIRCNCDFGGSVNTLCGADDMCQCKEGVTGQFCDQCDFGYYGLTHTGCKGTLDSNVNTYTK